MKKCSVRIKNPGNLSMEELKKQMENPGGIPLWQMHPAVQHCLRVYREKHPGSVQWKSRDACTWVDCHVPTSQMFLEPYRLKDGSFNIKFIEHETCMDMWNKFRDR